MQEQTKNNLDDFIDDLQVVVQHHKAISRTRYDEHMLEHIRKNLQAAETSLDSLTQKLLSGIGKENDWYKKARIAYNNIRQLQFTYPELKVVNHSLLRYSDSKINEDGKIERRFSKSNFRKFKRIAKRKELVPLA